jgi:membrane protein YdbS with pleckstrin-like domain
MIPADPANDWPGESPWLPLPDAAKRCFQVSSGISGLIFGLILGAVPVVISLVQGELSLLRAVAGIAILMICLGLAMWRASLAFRFTRWRLDEDGLRVRRGRFWRTEVLIPRARVQHLDIERGPIERRFGLATLVVHTAGTRLNAVRQPGFDDHDASRLRDALVPQHREHDDAPL